MDNFEWASWVCLRHSSVTADMPPTNNLQTHGAIMIHMCNLKKGYCTVQYMCVRVNRHVAMEQTFKSGFHAELIFNGMAVTCQVAACTSAMAKDAVRFLRRCSMASFPALSRRDARAKGSSSESVITNIFPTMMFD